MPMRFVRVRVIQRPFSTIAQLDQIIFNMDKILINWDMEGNTLNVWFDDPHTEHICEETGDEVVLVKNQEGRVIGFEKLNFQPSDLLKAHGMLPVEVEVA